MKTKIYILFGLLIIFASCSSLQQTTVNDDIYYSPKDEVVMASKSIEANQNTEWSEEYSHKIADILQDESKQKVDTTIYEDEGELTYNDLIVNDYQEAYERRRSGTESPYYGLNSLTIYNSDAFWLASSFINDPYYNVVIVGDQVWVEPYYITSSFGSWPARTYYGSWNYPYYRTYSYYSYYSYYSPYYYDSWYYSHRYYGHGYYGYPYYSYYYNDYPYHAIGSAKYKYGRRDYTTGSYSSLSSNRAQRELPENYVGRDIRKSNTVKSNLDRQSVSTRTARGNTNTRISSERENTRTSTTTSRDRLNTGTRTSDNTRLSTDRTYTRSTNTTRSTYNRSTRSSTTTRYNRPTSTSRSSVNKSSGSSRSTGYSNSRSGSSRSGSSYRTSRSNNSSSSRSSGVRSSSGSSRSSSSSGSSRSSSSSGSSRSKGGRR